MLLLLFSMGKERYAIDATQVIEVAPLAELKSIPRAPAFVAGVLNYRGRPVPVIDLNQLNLGRAFAPAMSTRIVLIQYRADAGEDDILGLIAERVTETVKMSDTDFQSTGITVPEAPYLGGVANDGGGMLQMIDLQRLLPADIAACLFTETAGHR